MAWLENLIGTPLSMGVKLTILFVALVIALLIIVWVARRLFGQSEARKARHRAPRLSVTDAAVVDDKRRLVLVRRDHVEHLVMIGGPSDIVIEQNIQRAAHHEGHHHHPANHQPHQPVAAPAEPAATAQPAAPVIATTAAAAGGIAAAAHSEPVAEAATAAPPEAADPASEFAASAAERLSGAAHKVETLATGTADDTRSSLSGIDDNAGDAGSADIGKELVSDLESLFSDGTPQSDASQARPATSADTSGPELDVAAEPSLEAANAGDAPDLRAERESGEMASTQHGQRSEPLMEAPSSDGTPVDPETAPATREGKRDELENLLEELTNGR